VVRLFSGTDRYNRVSCCSERIIGARILLSTAPNAEDIVWASKFTESLASYTFGRSNRSFSCDLLRTLLRIKATAAFSTPNAAIRILVPFQTKFLRSNYIDFANCSNLCAHKRWWRTRFSIEAVTLSLLKVFFAHTTTQHFFNVSS
jgi:hypothetical protein